MRVDAEVDGGIMRECGVMIAPGEACFPLSHRDRPICTRDFDSTDRGRLHIVTLLCISYLFPSLTNSEICFRYSGDRSAH